MDQRLLLITPVRDEAENVEEVVAGVAGQSRAPDLWLVVDDGSGDGTRERFEQHAARLPYLRVVSTPPDFTRDSGDRLAAAAPDRAWNFGLREAGEEGFTHFGKLDGDIVMPSNYLAEMLGRFAADPQLGMAGGAIVEREGDGWRALKTPADHVTAPARIYSRECLEAIDGMPEQLGADVITTTYARMRGYRTATFADLEVKHLRPIGTAQGALRGRARHGAYQWIVHYSLLWVALRSLLVAVRFRPYGISGLWFLGGYLGAALRGVPRVEDPEFRRFQRREQRQRLRRALGRGGREASPATGPAAGNGDEQGRRREVLLETIDVLESFGHRSGWVGTDPYDGLNATRFDGPFRRTATGRRILTQLVKRSPLDLRPLFGIPPTRNATTVAWAVSAYARGSFLPAEVQRARLDESVRTLLAMRLPDWDLPCWSYPFQMQTRVLNYPRTSPNSIATAFAALALIDAYEVTGEQHLLEIARDVGRWFVREVPQTEDPPGARFGYLVGDSSPIHNSNTHVCAVLARLVQHGVGEPEYPEMIRAGLTWTLERQRPDGSWPYGERDDLEWVDGFHTGYVLDSLRFCADSGVDPRAEAAWERGLEYWRRNLFEADGTAKYYNDNAYPLDTQSAAQGIQTLAIAAERHPDCLDQAWLVLDWALANMRRRDGLFYFQRRRHWTNRLAHIRWSETCMFLALTHLLAAEESRRGSVVGVA
jgi:poly-beta-1,6-N-acetyl-D-glucosamine synthase